MGPSEIVEEAVCSCESALLKRIQKCHLVATIEASSFLLHILWALSEELSDLTRLDAFDRSMNAAFTSGPFSKEDRLES